MSTPITIDRDKNYRMTWLVFNGLAAQIPNNVGLGHPWREDPDNWAVLEGEMVYRLDEHGISVEDACNAVYGKSLIDMGESLYDLDPKIWEITDPLIKETREDHRTLDYRTALTQPLYPKRTTVKGEVVSVDWYRDQELTDKVINVEISYTRDTFGFAQERTTIRRWVMNNGEYHPKTKVTKKDYTINLEDQIQEGKRRRRNIVNGVQLPVIGAMQEILIPMGYSSEEVLLLAREAMDHLEDFFNKFIDNSSTVTDVNDPNLGRKKIVVEFERMANNDYPWMKTPATVLGGASIEEYVVNEFSI